MSSELPKDYSYSVLERSEENQTRKKRKVVTPSDTKNATSSFRMLSADLLLSIFEWIGYDDMNNYIHLASIGDQFIEQFIYKDCKFLWKKIDLSEFPQLTDAKLHSLLVRANAKYVTTSIVFDKNTTSPISGEGLEPLESSKVLERIDLRQSTSVEVGPTGLNDQRVAEILSTIVPHKLMVVKIRKQFHSEHHESSFDEYCFPWKMFFSTMTTQKALLALGKSCSHCERPIRRTERMNSVNSMLLMLSWESTQCTICEQYFCFPFVDANSSLCTLIRECNRCLEQCCRHCRTMTGCNYCHKNICSDCEPNPLQCPTCRKRSCLDCKSVRQCRDCTVTSCSGCPNAPNIRPCDRCKGSFCADCRTVFVCDHCSATICDQCYDFSGCGQCERQTCQDCCNDLHKRFKQCEICFDMRCDRCEDLETSYVHCPYCDLVACNEDCSFDFRIHDCVSPGERLHEARDAIYDVDDSNSLCACGKKHLESKGGQKFMCSFVTK